MKTDFAANIRRYSFGFLASVLLTLASYQVAQIMGGESTMYIVVGILLLLAGAQLVVQLICFLHLKYEKLPYSKLNVFLFAFVMMLIVVIGSLWVMKNLDYNMMMAPEEIEPYMLEQNGKGF